MGASLYTSLYPNVKPNVALLNIGSEELKGNETIKKIIKSSAFCSSDDKIVSDNYKIVKKQNFSIIPPIGGG